MKKRTAHLMILTAFVAFSFAPAAFADTLTGTGAFQTWVSPNENGNPYWDHTSFDGSGMNIGYYMTKTGGLAGSNGPGVAYPFWGGAYTSGTDTGGAADLNFFFTNTGSSHTITFKAEITNFDGHHVDGNNNPIPGNIFGWFVTDATGSFIGTKTQIFDSNTQDPVVVNSSSDPLSQYFGFYLTSERGTFYTLSGFDSIAPGLPLREFQHFAAFQESANAYWIGIEDLITNSTSVLEDKDYNDMVVRIESQGEFIPPTSTPEPSSMMLLGSGLLVVSIGIALRRRVFKR